MDVRLRALLLGLASGSRSTYGTAAVVLTAPAVGSDAETVERVVGGTPAKIGAAVAAAGETVGDKLPQTPARTAPPGLGSRIAGAAGSGALISRRYSTAPGSAAGIAVAASLLTTYAGPPVRARAARRLGRDLWGALLEDALAASLAFLAVRR